jgi:hypothetical protein
MFIKSRRNNNLFTRRYSQGAALALTGKALLFIAEPQRKKDADMKRLALAALAALLLTICPEGPCLAQPQAPNHLAGIELGANVANFRELLNIKTSHKIKETPWLSRVDFKPTAYFRGGYVVFGECSSPGRIVRLKLKYQDEGMDFFRKVIMNLLDRYGNPAEYKGDLEGQVMGNKWSFTNAEGDSISLIIQRYMGEDLDMTRGNIVKLTDWTLMDAERSCYEFKHGVKAPPPTPKAPDFEGFLPK